MRGLRAEPFSYFCCVGGEWHSKTKTSLGVGAPVSPHPNPLPVGEGDKNSFRSLQALAPSTNISDALPVDPICPIIRFTMLLGYGYHDDCFFIKA